MIQLKHQRLIMQRDRLFVALMLFFLPSTTFGQISAPGLGRAKIASWFAMGVRQDLDTIENSGWQSMSYIGMGWKSNPDNYDPFSKPAELVFNQEFNNHYRDHWQYSFAMSYRRKEKYADDKPYEHENPKRVQEFRIYSRFSYLINTPYIKFSPTIRQEYRKFWTPDFKNATEDFQLRTRLKLQLTLNLNAQKIHRIIVSSEQLFSISKLAKINAWSDFNYRDSRFSLNYSLSPEELPFTFNVGYMNNLVGVKTPFDTHYLACSLILKNPF